MARVLACVLAMAGLLGACDSPRREAPPPAPIYVERAPEPAPAPPPPPTHVVQRGDGWWTIARAHGVTMRELLAVNGRDESAVLHPGDVVVLRSSSALVAPKAAPRLAPATEQPPPRAVFAVAIPEREPTVLRRTLPYRGNGGGPTLCADGSVSGSSGRGTCSHHGGIAR